VLFLRKYSHLIPGKATKSINHIRIGGVRVIQNGFPYHETMELHELLNFKTICMVKSKMISGIVFDQELKSLLEKDVQQSILAVGELEQLYAVRTQVQITGSDNL
jgi:similar to spore coat protein